MVYIFRSSSVVVLTTKLSWIGMCPWSALAVQTDPCTAAFFHNSIHVVVGEGMATLLWSDKWIDGRCIADFAPDLVNVVPRRKRNSVFVSAALPDHAWMLDVLGALTVAVLVQYSDLRQRQENWSL
jgi:hypothetical protein